MTPLIRLQQINRTYTWGQHLTVALKDVTLDIPQGQFVSIMGPSGCGKSTLLNVLGCLDRPTGGRYLLQGEDVARMSDDELAAIRNQRIGMVFQQFQLLQRSPVINSVTLPMVYAGIPLTKRREQALEALARVGLADRAMSMPNELSGGQMQRVAIARAIAMRPPLLLADEPTGALDSDNGARVMDLLVDLHREGATLVLVTHDDQIGARAQRLIRFRDGVVVSDSAPERVDHAA
jgi:putative ABC transport system ATP-binding protein